MEINDLLREYLASICHEDKFQIFRNFFDICNDEELNPSLTKNILGSTAFKHGFAKYIVKRIADGELCLIHNNDARLSAFISYFAVIRLLNGPADDLIVKRLGEIVKTGGWGSPFINGYASGSCGKSIAPVTMCPGGGLHPGYRMFTVNLLCFKDSKFLMGIRTKGGPVYHMKYHKGCAPLGIKKDANGREWTLFKIDSSLSDDYTAIFSNYLDGDGTVEICDWVSDSDVRVVFRSDF